eukprot:403343795
MEQHPVMIEAHLNLHQSEHQAEIDLIKKLEDDCKVMDSVTRPRVRQNRRRGEPHYLHEDQPAYKHAVIIPYYHNQRTNQVHIYTSMQIEDDCEDESFKPIRASIKQREPSILFTIARELMLKTRYYLPWEGASHIQNNDEAPLFYNPAMTYTLSHLLKDDRVVINIQDDTWRVWYPLDNLVDIEEVNNALDFFDLEIKELVVDNFSVTESVSPIDATMSIDDVELLKDMLTYLKRRITQDKPRPIEYAMVLDDDQNVMKHMYEAMYVGQLMRTGEEKFNFYRGYDQEHPDDETLQNLKLIIFPGSVQSCYDQNLEWMPPLMGLIRKVYDNFPQIKLIGGCYGHQLIAYSLGGIVSRTPAQDGLVLPILGREPITLLDNFFNQTWAKSYLTKSNLNREQVPPLVLQQSHGDRVEALPKDAILVGTSNTCDIEMYTIPNRVLCFQSHPEFNANMQLELSEVESYAFGDMWDVKKDFKKEKYLNICNSKVVETRNMFLGLIREFIYHDHEKTSQKYDE